MVAFFLVNNLLVSDKKILFPKMLVHMAFAGFLKMSLMLYFPYLTGSHGTDIRFSYF